MVQYVDNNLIALLTLEELDQLRERLEEMGQTDTPEYKLVMKEIEFR